MRQAGCNYHGHDFSLHLSSVANKAIEHIDMIPEEDQTDVIVAAWCHDVLEDCPINFNDMVEVIGRPASDIVYNVTDELGKNRWERAIRTYPKIAACELSIFVKLCDRYANVKYCRDINSSHINAYKKQWPLFQAIMESSKTAWRHYQPLVKEVDELLS